MVHLQQENKKLKSEIEEKKVKSGNTRLCKALGLNKLEAPQRAKMCGTLSWRESSSDTAQRMDITKYVGTPQCSGKSAMSFATVMSFFLVPCAKKSVILFFQRSLDQEFTEEENRSVMTSDHWLSYPGPMIIISTSVGKESTLKPILI